MSTKKQLFSGFIVVRKMGSAWTFFMIMKVLEFLPQYITCMKMSHWAVTNSSWNSLQHCHFEAVLGLILRASIFDVEKRDVVGKILTCWFWLITGQKKVKNVNNIQLLYDYIEIQQDCCSGLFLVRKTCHMGWKIENWTPAMLEIMKTCVWKA